MKFIDILKVTNKNTTIRLVVSMYGTYFQTEHYPKYYLDDEMKELYDREVKIVKIMDGVLTVILK